MSLTDLMSGAGLSRFAEAALVLFLLAFVVAAAMLFAPGRRAELEATRLLPLDDPNDHLGRPE